MRVYGGGVVGLHGERADEGAECSCMGRGSVLPLPMHARSNLHPLPIQAHSTPSSSLFPCTHHTPSIYYMEGVECVQRRGCVYGRGGVCVREERICVYGWGRCVHGERMCVYGSGGVCVHGERACPHARTLQPFILPLPTHAHSTPSSSLSLLQQLYMKCIRKFLKIQSQPCSFQIMGKQFVNRLILILKRGA